MDATVADPVIGRLLDGRYTAQERLAVGGMATVYVAHDNRLDRLVALKVMHANLNHDPEFVARFHREARAVARLNTPRVVSVLDQGSDHTPAGLVNYLVMELVRGRSLRQHLGVRGRLSVAEAVEIIEPVFEALAAAHQAGIIHRDIKPENILLGDDGQVKVADFGLARPLGQPTEALSDGVVMGTVGYLAPEQVTHGTADTRSDIYAAGIVLFETLTGQLPHSGATAMSMAYQSVHGDVPAPSTVVDGIPAELDDLVLRATARQPAMRPADGTALTAELELIAPYLPVQAQYPTGFTAEVERIGLMAPPPGDGPPAAFGPGMAEPDTYRLAPRASGPRPGIPGAAGSPSGPGSGPEGRALRTSLAADPFNDGDLDDEYPDDHSGHYLPAGDAGRSSGGRRRLPVGPGRPRWQVPLLIGGVAVVALVISVLSMRTLTGNKIEVPMLANLSKSDAETVLRLAGLKFTYLDPVTSPTVPANHVARQEPRDGTKVDKGAAVTLRLSSGPATIPVPDLANSSLEQARSRLREADLTEGGQTLIASDTVSAGHVIRTEPAANAVANPKDPVKLYLSSGPDTRTMPDVVGKPYEDARKQVERLGVAGVTVQRVDIQTPIATSGTVLSAAPAAGQPLAPNTPVTLTVAVAAQEPDQADEDGGDGSGKEIVVPNLFKLSFANAGNLLGERGLKIRRNGLLGSPGDPVLSQSPRAGSKIERGSTVRVNTGWGVGN